MYYGNDENGNIIFSDQNSVLPEEYQTIFPENYSDISVSSGDPQTSSSNSGSVQYNYYALSGGQNISYDDLAEVLANVPAYNVYPNVSAVNVFQQVLNGLTEDVGYFVISGSDTYSTYLYYSPDYTVSGNTIVLQGDVKQCFYHQYRPSSSSTWLYTYTVSDVGEQSVSVSNGLIYTNLIDGYPDLIPYKQKESYNLLFSIPVILIATFLINKFVVRRNYV